MQLDQTVMKRQCDHCIQTPEDTNAKKVQELFNLLSDRFTMIIGDKHIVKCYSALLIYSCGMPLARHQKILWDFRHIIAHNDNWCSQDLMVSLLSMQGSSRLWIPISPPFSHCLAHLEFLCSLQVSHFLSYIYRQQTFLYLKLFSFFYFSILSDHTCDLT